jgi:hypothetical protein
LLSGVREFVQKGIFVPPFRIRMTISWCLPFRRQTSQIHTGRTSQNGGALFPP